MFPWLDGPSTPQQMYKLAEASLRAEENILQETLDLSELSPTYCDVLQVQVFVVHHFTQLPDFFFDLFDLLCRELILVGRTFLVKLQKLDHQFQAGPVEIHVQTIPTQNVHQGRGAQSKILK